MLTTRIQFENAMRRGLNLKQLKAEFPQLSAAAIQQKITYLGYHREYLTNEEWTHILKRRRVDETTAQ